MSSSPMAGHGLSPLALRVEPPTEGATGRRVFDLLVALALSASLFGLYALGACRTIYVGDSGELVAAVHLLGIPHPSGYPLYVLLGKLWTLALPVGSIAFRMSLFSSACAAVCGALLFLLARRLGLAKGSALFVSLLLASSPSFWSQANIQRVYALNALLLVVALDLAVRWRQSRRDRYLVAAVFAATLGASNHTYMGAFAGALALWALITDRRLVKRVRTLAGCTLAGLAGLAPYLFLLLRSGTDPRLDWGNPETLPRLLAVMLRREAWERAWIERPGDLVLIAADYLRGIGSELLWVGALLAALGLLAARPRRWPLLLLLLAMAGNLATMALHGSRSDLFLWHRYYIPSYLVAALLAGLGLEAITRRRWRWLRLAALGVPLVLLVTGYPRFDRSRYRIAEDFSRTLLSTLPPGAHLSANDDNILFVLIYLHLVEGLRPDVDLILEGVGEAELPPLYFDPDVDPLFLTHHSNWSAPGLAVVPIGLAFQTVRSDRPRPEVRIPKRELAGETDPGVPKDYLTQNLIGHFHYMLGISHEQIDWLVAESEFAAARRAASDNDVLFYNLGLIYRRNGLLQRSLAAFEHSHAINPRHIASRRRVRALDRISELRSEIARLAALERSLLAARGLTDMPAGPERHEVLADALASRGEPIAARGHTLRALELRQRPETGE